MSQITLYLDEATQALEPECLVALSMGAKQASGRVSGAATGCLAGCWAGQRLSLSRVPLSLSGWMDGWVLGG